MSKLKKRVKSKPSVRKAPLVWKIRAHARPTLPADIGMGVLFVLPITLFAFGWQGDVSVETKGTLIGGGVISVVIYLYLWVLGVRQKTVFEYHVDKFGGDVTCQLYYPKYAGRFFKGLAIFALIAILSMISIDPSLIWIAAGPAGISIAAAIKLLNWENPIEHHATDWARYDLVFIDRKRKMVVPSFHADPLAGFEIHLEKARIDDFVAFLKTVIPHAEFREAEWKW